jgi:hypothetical protein
MKMIPAMTMALVGFFAATSFAQDEAASAAENAAVQEVSGDESASTIEKQDPRAGRAKERFERKDAKKAEIANHKAEMKALKEERAAARAERKEAKQAEKEAKKADKEAMKAEKEISKAERKEAKVAEKAERKEAKQAEKEARKDQKGKGRHK